MLSLLDLVDLEDLIGLKSEKNNSVTKRYSCFKVKKEDVLRRWDRVGLGLLSDPEEAPEKKIKKYIFFCE